MTVINGNYIPIDIKEKLVEFLGIQEEEELGRLVVVGADESRPELAEMGWEETPKKVVAEAG